MKVLHVGPPSSVHTQIAALRYKALGFEATFLNTRIDRVFDAIPGVAGATNIVNASTSEEPPRFSRHGNSLIRSLGVGSRYIGIHDQTLHRILSRLRHHTKFDVIIGTWGVPVLPSMLAVQRMFPESACIFNVLSIPELPIEGTSRRARAWRLYRRVYDAFEHSAYVRMLAECDVRVHCSKIMRRFMKGRGMLRGPGIDVVDLERFPRVFFPSERLHKRSDGDGAPHVIHLGATNFSGHDIDDLSRQLERLADAGVHVHFSSKDNFQSVRSNFYHTFPPFPTDEIGSALASYSTQFDAAIILYNIDKPYDRFTNALPTRFLFALTIGIPIAIPAGLFQSCEEYVTRHDIGIIYKNEVQLANMLRDRALMHRVSARALKHSQDKSVEDAFPEYRRMVQQAIFIRRARRGLSVDQTFIENEL
jgi:hypothetical protein